MATFAVDKNETVAFIRAGDKHEENPPVFLIGHLPHSIRKKIEDTSATFKMNQKEPDQKADVEYRTGSRYYEAVRYGLKGWRNFRTRNGQDVEFGTSNVNGIQVVKESCMDLIPFDALQEIGQAILHENRMTEQDQKN